MDMKKLTERQRRFADEYIISGNAYRSAINAGYAETSARTQAHTLLENAGIKAYLEKHLNKLSSERIARQTEILEFLTATMRGEITEPVSIFIGEGVQDIVEVKPNVQTRRQAGLDMLKRYDTLPKTELEIRKMEKELESEETLEDKLDVIIENFDTEAGGE